MIKKNNLGQYFTTNDELKEKIFIIPSDFFQINKFF